MNKVTSILISSVLSVSMVLALSGTINNTLYTKSEAYSGWSDVYTGGPNSDYYFSTYSKYDDIVTHRESFQTKYTGTDGLGSLSVQVNVEVRKHGLVHIEMIARNYRSNCNYNLGSIICDDNWYEYVLIHDSFGVSDIPSYCDKGTVHELIQSSAVNTGQRVIVNLIPITASKGSNKVTVFDHEIDVSATDLSWVPYDVNTDGVVNTLDLVSLKKYLLGYSCTEEIPVQTEPIVTEVTEITTEPIISTTIIEECAYEDDPWHGVEFGDPFAAGDPTGLTVYDMMPEITTEISSVSSELVTQEPVSDEVSDTVTTEPLEAPIIVSPLGFTLHTDVGHVFVSSLKIINNTDDTLRVSAIHVTMNNRLPIFEASHILWKTFEPKSVTYDSDSIVIDLYVEPELLESVEIQLQFENADTHQFVYLTDMIPIYTTDKE